MIQIYGTTLKALVHEQFGDGIISAINFKLDMKKVEDPEGGSPRRDHPRRQVPATASVLRMHTKPVAAVEPREAAFGCEAVAGDWSVSEDCVLERRLAGSTAATG